MKRFILNIILGIILFQPGFSQLKEAGLNKILFHGLVLDASTLAPISNSQIHINGNFASVSGNDGTFAFQVIRNDTVLFKSLGYKPTTMIITDTLTGKEFIVGIYMTSDTMIIGEVVIIPKYLNLKSEMMNGRSKTPSIMDNARYNVAVGAYQGKNGIASMNDPASNYEAIRQKQRVQAYEKGGIPSDQILGFNFLSLIPAAAYLLINGVPEKTDAMKPSLTPYELDQIQKRYFEQLKLREKK